MTTIEKNIGVYIVTHIDSGKTYIGASRNLNKRRYHHYRELHNGTHRVTELLVDFQMTNSGNSAVDFRVLEYCDFDQLAEAEKSYIDALKPDYNHRTGGGGIRPYCESLADKQRARWTGKQMRKVGTFITPFGSFESSYLAADRSEGTMTQYAVWRSCKDAERRINRSAWSKSAFLKRYHDESVIGKTWAELGFGFVADEQK
jgi:group I intron endonuclease